MEIKASQIATIINEIYDGVERSRCGKILRYEAKEGEWLKDPDGHYICGILNQIPYQTFLVLVQNIVPKRFDSITEFKHES